MNQKPNVTRRRFVQGSVAVAATALMAACRSDTAARAPAASPTQALAQRPASATAQPVATRPPTPSCDDDDDEPTIAQTEGPYFTPNSPERTSFLSDGPGSRLVMTGRVLSADCAPIAGALIDFWHTNDAGQYDNAGYNFRGHQFTDANGLYRLETVLPGLYPGRTRHFHVKVQRPNGPILTTQLYFPDEPQNHQDGIFNPALLMAVQADAGDGQAATFDFVLT